MAATDLGYADFAFTIYRGDDREIAVVAKQTKDPASPRQNITGWSLWFTAKLTLDDLDNAAVFQKKTGGLGITITAPLTGDATITLASADTASLSAPRLGTSPTLFCDLQGKDGLGKIKTLASGKLTVVADTTRAIV